jgi:carboxyl-terminal processing protease
MPAAIRTLLQKRMRKRRNDAEFSCIIPDARFDHSNSTSHSISGAMPMKTIASIVPRYRTVLIVLFFLSFASFNARQATAQSPDATNHRLFLLCKTWGYLKYFSQNKCALKWDTLLNTTVNRVLVSGNDSDFENALRGLFLTVGQNAHQSSPPAHPDTNINVDIAWIVDPSFPDFAREFLATFAANIAPDSSTCFIKRGTYQGGYNSYIDFRPDPLSMPITYANEANRLTTMFYYWNAINYFHPYRSIMDQPWDSTLSAFIPLIRAAKGSDGFHQTFLKLVTKINDSHGSVTSARLTANFWGGTYYPAIYFKRVEDKCVVAKVKDVPGVVPGDVLTAIGGISLGTIEDSLRRYIPASTPAAFYRDAYSRMNAGGLASAVDMTFVDSSGVLNTLSVPRSMSASTRFYWVREYGTSPPYVLTNCGYGYVNLGILQQTDLSAMYFKLKDAPVIILDLRHGPNVNLSDLVQLFFRRPVKSTRYYDPALSVQSSGYQYLPGWYYTADDSEFYGSWSNTNAYHGSLYILVNEETQSAMEYDCQYLSYHPGAKVIGTQTAGADGNVSELALPGDIATDFTSLGWYYADGYQQQRNGVKIDLTVKLTIAGIRQGKDEILNAALDCLTETANVAPSTTMLAVSPNPVSHGTAHVTYSLERPAGATLSLFDMTGTCIRNIQIEAAPGINHISFDVATLAAGVYMLVMKNGRESVNQKIVID